MALPPTSSPHEWSAYTDSQALKELAGLRAVTPSVRFLEKLPTSSTKQKIYHVRQDELIYLSGVEMFQDGTDCVSIIKINSAGVETELASGGTSISSFLNLKNKQHNVSVYEYPPFEDFWVEPYLVNNASKQIVKSNFFRSFKFLDEGYYRIQLNERLNPLTGSTGFVANYSSSHYNQPTSPSSYVRSLMNGSYTSQVVGADGEQYPWNNGQYSSSNSPAPIQALRIEGEFKREILIRVISKNKDIVTGNSIKRRIINGIPGKSNISASQTPNPNASIIIGDKRRGTAAALLSSPPGAFHYKGNGTFFVQNRRWNIDTVLTSGVQNGFYGYATEGYNFFFYTADVTNGQLEDLHVDSNMELLPISRKIYVGGKINNGSISSTPPVFNYGSSTPFNSTEPNTTVTDSLRKIKVINLRNSIIENITFIGGDDGLDCPNKQPYYQFGQDFSKLNPDTGQSLVIGATIDLSGSVIKNCTFIGNNSIGSMGWGNAAVGGSDSINTRFLLDGCVFENCKFVSTPVLEQSRYVGILYKNCTFENKTRSGGSSNNGMYEGEAVCYMSCNWNSLGRFMFFEDQGSVSNNTIIRCHEKNRGMFGNAGESLTVDQYQTPQSDKEGCLFLVDAVNWKVRLNLFLMNETSFTFSPLTFSSFFGKSEFNLTAFTTTDKSGSGDVLQGKNPEGELVSVPTNAPTALGSFDVNNNWLPDGKPIGWRDSTRTSVVKLNSNYSGTTNNYNVYLHNHHNDISGSFLNLTSNSNWNRHINTVWNGGMTGSFYGFTTYPSINFRNTGGYGNTAFNISLYPTNSITNPVYNLINNCSMVEYNDQLYLPKLYYDANEATSLQNGFNGMYGAKEEFYGSPYRKTKGFRYKDEPQSIQIEGFVSSKVGFTEYILTVTKIVSTGRTIPVGTQNTEILGLFPPPKSSNNRYTFIHNGQVPGVGTPGGTGEYRLGKKFNSVGAQIDQSVPQQTMMILTNYPLFNIATNPYGMHPNGETDAQLKTRLDNEENVLHNLTKISLRDT